MSVAIEVVSFGLGVIIGMMLMLFFIALITIVDEE